MNQSTDLEIVKRCAELMGWRVFQRPDNPIWYAEDPDGTHQRVLVKQGLLAEWRMLAGQCGRGRN